MKSKTGKNIMPFLTIIYLIIIFIAFYANYNLSSFLKVKLYYLTMGKQYLSILNNLCIFIVTILYLAISFKTVSIWKMSFISYLKHQHKLWFKMAGFCVFLTILINFFALTNICKLNIYLSTFIYVSLIYIFLIIIGIVFRELSRAGDKKEMDQSVSNLLVKSIDMILNTIDYDEPIENIKYYSFLEDLDNTDLMNLYLSVTNEMESVTNLEYLCYELLIKKKNKSEIDSFEIKKKKEYISYLFKNSCTDNNLLFPVADDILDSDEYSKVLSLFKSSIDRGDVSVSYLYNPLLQSVYKKNKILVDELIIYAMENPNQNKENFLFRLIENAIRYSTTYLSDDVIKFSDNKKKLKLRLDVYDIWAYYNNNTDIKTLDFRREQSFFYNIASLSGLKLLIEFQREYAEMAYKSTITGLYSCTYKEIVKEYSLFQKKIDLLFVNVPESNKKIDKDLPFMSLMVTSNNINYNELSDNLKKKIEKEMEPFENKVNLILREKIKLLFSKEEYISFIKSQIIESNNIAMKIFLKLNAYVIDNKNKTADNLSKNFYASLHKMFTNEDFSIHSDLHDYLVNINFILYKKNILEYDRFDKIPISFLDVEKNISFIDNNNVKITYNEAFGINYLVNLIQYYVDNGKIPVVRNIFTQENMLVDEIKKSIDTFRTIYDKCSDNKYTHRLQGHEGYRTIKVVDEGLQKTSKISTVLQSNHILSFEKRIVFHILIKLLLGYKITAVFDNEESYTKKIIQLFDSLDISYIKQQEL